MTNHLGHLNDSEFEDLKKVFYSQAYEIVENLQDLLLTFEASPDAAALKAVKRHIHTLKGDSNSIGLTSVGTLCHSMEDILSFIADGSRGVKQECTDLLLSSVDIMSRLLSESESGTNGTGITEIIGRIEAFLQKDTGPSGQITSESGARASEFTDYQELQILDAAKNGLTLYELEIVFHPLCADRGSAAFMVTQRLKGMGQVIRSRPDLESSDIDCADRMTILLAARPGIEEIKRDAFVAGITDEIHVGDWSQEAENRSQMSDVRIPGAESQTFNARNELLRVEASRVDKIMDLAGELIIGRSMIEQVARDMENGASRNDISDRLFAVNSYMERTVGDLQKGIMKMRMVPINHVFRKFPKIVRDLSAEKGRKVRLDIKGKETELDKGIVDALGEPLAHIFRNFIDHGIEDPDYRRSINKPEEGVIALKAYHEAAQIVIEASDDGRGIDRDRLKKKAVKMGFLTEVEAEKLSEHEALNLIFLSGLSTSETVSETSGRGVGMDAVKSAVDAMKGSMEVESTPGKGTMFRLRFPLTLAVIKALLFKVGRRLYAIPMSAIADVTRIMMNDLITVDGKDTFIFRDRIISVIRLQELFKIEGEDCKRKFILILGLGSKKIGVLVDCLKGQQELVIKAVDDRYIQTGLVTGASILGNGRVVLILDAPALFRKAVEDERKGTVRP